MKTTNIALFLVGGVLLFGAGYMANSVFSRVQPEGDSPEAVIQEWRGVATGTIEKVAEFSITIEKEGARVIVGITKETAVAKSVIGADGKEQVTPITIPDLRKGNRASVAVVLTDGLLHAEAIRVLEEVQ